MSAPQSHKGIILVADDNEANRELLSALLSAEGYQVVCAADGQQARARVNSDSIDLALLDVVMPGRTGFEICQEMKSKPETRLIPVILLTSLNSDADRIHGIMCGADDFLNKPVNKHELLARVHSLLRLKQFTDELDNAETVLFSLVLPIIRHHHEKQDGSGYPDGLKGEQIPLTARILQVTDIYDALTTDRPYRKALSTEKAFTIIREEVKRGWWDHSLSRRVEILMSESALLFADLLAKAMR